LAVRAAGINGPTCCSPAATTRPPRSPADIPGMSLRRESSPSALGARTVRRRPCHGRRRRRPQAGSSAVGVHERVALAVPETLPGPRSRRFPEGSPPHDARCSHSADSAWASGCSSTGPQAVLGLAGLAARGAAGRGVRGDRPRRASHADVCYGSARAAVRVEVVAPDAAPRSRALRRGARGDRPQTPNLPDCDLAGAGHRRADQHHRGGRRLNGRTVNLLALRWAPGAGSTARRWRARPLEQKADAAQLVAPPCAPRLARSR